MENIEETYDFVRVRVREPFQITAYKALAGEGQALKEALTAALSLSDGEYEIELFNSAEVDDVITASNDLHKRLKAETANGDDIPPIVA